MSPAQDVVGLLADAQFRALIALANKLNADFIGLSAAARSARRAKVICPNTARKLERLDVAAHFARHATVQRMEHFLAQIVAQIGAVPAQAVIDAPGTHCFTEDVAQAPPVQGDHDAVYAHDDALALPVHGDG